MMPAFIINVRNKERHIAKAVAGALSQTVPCEIIVSDYGSTDGTLAAAQKAVETWPRAAEHTVRVVECPLGNAQGTMQSMNDHVWWLIGQTDAEWIYQSSGDDYSLPDRVKVCMEAVAANPCSAVATTMFFEGPGETNRDKASGYPRESGYVKAGDGLTNLAYGSVIAGYRKDFLLKAGNAGNATPDVFWGYLASLEQGFYVVANPQHVHVEHGDAQNTGFQGKMKHAMGDELMRLSERNHLQLLELYFSCADKAQELRNGAGPIPDTDWLPLINMILGQAKGVLTTRRLLSERGITPGRF